MTYSQKIEWIYVLAAREERQYTIVINNPSATTRPTIAKSVISYFMIIDQSAEQKQQENYYTNGIAKGTS